ncbi:MAG: response regulator [Parvularcula sp.]
MNAKADQPKILVVDDEPSIREPLAEYLSANGMIAIEAENAAIAREIIERDRPDLVVLDIMMPGEDGLSLTRDLRANRTIPIILLTAKSEDLDRIVGLEMGADDYLGKPFNPRELLARIRTVLRRAETPASVSAQECYRFAGFELDKAARVLRDPGGEPIELTGGEFTLLLVLVERAGRVLDRNHLLDLTQGREAGVFDRSVDNQVSRLRKKIEQDAKKPDIIKTVRGGGYILSTKVTRA